MKTRSIALVAVSLSIAAIALPALGQTPLSTAFTYQGRLDQAGAPLNGTADFEFRLFGAAAGSSQIGTTQTVSNVTITGGLFTASLNFGVTVFDGDARWLQIAVRSPAGGGAFTTLSPRQPLTATPYALQTRGIFVDAANRVGIGTTTPTSLLHVNGTVVGRHESGVAGIGYLGHSLAGAYSQYGSAGNFGYLGHSLVGVYGQNATSATYGGIGDDTMGAYGVNSDGSYGYLGQFARGVEGLSNQVNGTGVVGIADNGSTAFGVYGGSANGYAGWFNGRVNVNGTFSSSNKWFCIDHPLDPENKYLQHSCVESDEMKNVYDGVVTLDANGSAWVELPNWFESLNGAFRYQLTCIGEFAPVYVAQKVQGNRFQIAGGKPGMEVSWLVTGVRQDAFAKTEPMRVEVEKEGSERGRYLHPEAFGLSETKGVNYEKIRAAESSVAPPKLQAMTMPLPPKPQATEPAAPARVEK